MTIASEVRRAGPYVGDGVRQIFEFDFKTFADGDLAVVLLTDTSETVLTLNSDYVVTLNPNQNTSPGGTITTLSAPAVGAQLTILSDRMYLQALNVQNAGGFFPDVFNNSLDNIVIQVQQLLDQMERMPRGALSDVAWGRLPPARDRVNGFFGFDDDGQPAVVSIDDITSITGLIEAIQTVAEIADEVVIVAENDVDVSVVADNIGDVNTVSDWIGTGGGLGTGEVIATGSTEERTLADRFSGEYDAADFLTLQAAITAAAATKKAVNVPAGNTAISASLTHSSGSVKLVGTDAGTNGSRLTTTMNDSIIDITAEMTVQGIGFIGSAEAEKTAQIGLKLTDVNNVHVRDCVFTDLYTSVEINNTTFYTSFSNVKFFDSKGPTFVGKGTGTAGYAIQFRGVEIIPTSITGSVFDYTNMGSVNSVGTIASPANATEYTMHVRSMATLAGAQQFCNEVYEGSAKSAIRLDGTLSNRCRVFFFSNCYANQAGAGEPTLLLQHVRTFQWIGGILAGFGPALRFNNGTAEDITIGPVRLELDSGIAAFDAVTGSVVRNLRLIGVTLDGGIQKLLDFSNLNAADVDNIYIDASTTFGTTASPVVMPAGAYHKLNWRHGNKFMATKGGTDQTGIVSDTASKITFGTEVYDVRDRFASSTWSPYTGFQRITCHVYATNVTSGTRCELQLYKNGALYLRGPTTIPQPDDSVMMEAAWEFLSEPGDTFDVYIRAVSGGTITVSGATNLTYLTGSQI